MSEPDAAPPRPSGGKPGRSAETETRDAERRKRLAAALRQNLKRRKGPADEGGRSDAGDAGGPDRD